MKLKNFLTLLLLFAATKALAYDFEVDGIYYNITGPSTVEVTYESIYEAYSADVVIPSAVIHNSMTYSVTAIGERAFEGNRSLTSVTIPNSVTSIKRIAFWNCSGLTSMTIPNSVTAIGERVFFGCTSLTSITVESDNPKYDSRNNCNAIIETASNTLIVGCKNTVIPNSVTALGNSAFDGCFDLASVSIPNSVTSIGKSAFSCCYSLTSVTISNSVIFIGNYAFDNCSGLTSIIVESGNPKYDSRNNCNAIIETSSNKLITGCKNTVIPNSVTAIGECAFRGCDGLTSVTIPNSVRSIARDAFHSCSSLKSVTFGNSLTTIDYYAFEYCRALTSVTIPKSVTFIGLGVFSSCNSLASITVESGNPKYDSRDNCNAIIETSSNRLVVGCQNTVIPNSISSISGWAFDGCIGLTSITIPSSVTYIGTSAFFDCGGLTDVYSFIVDLSVISMSDDVFYKNPGGIDYSARTLHVPQGTADTYQADSRWYPYFGQIVEMDSETGLIGDVNDDGYVDIADVNAIVDIIQGRDGYTITADVNGDGEINIADINAIINIIIESEAVNDEHEWVDLGLPSGTLWATRNVGATAPEDIGDYFAWGETEPKEVYSWETYKWCKGAKNMLTKYCTKDEYGSVDDKTELEPEDDAATENCGELWRTPTMEQLEELFWYCSWQWTTCNGVSGRLFKGRNGNTIFLPAGGFRSDESLEEENIEGFYWSRTLYTGIPSGANSKSFDTKYTTTRLGYSRNYGLSVRPVRMQPIDIQPRSIDFGEITIGKTFTRDLTVINNTAEDQIVTVTADAPFLLKQEEDAAAASITIVVPGKSSSMVTVVFTATEVGEFNGNVTFSNPAMDDGQMAIPVRAGAYTNEVPQYVDLGLPSGTLWATCNIGASTPEEFGNYFAWGETTPKEVYSWETYKWCKGSRETITKYCTDSYFGTVDGKTELEPADDAATANWGPEWCMPIVELQKELMESCTWTWTTMNGVNGHLFTGPNGNTMFWPAAGFYTDETLGNAGSFGGYWSSSGGNTTACEMGFNGASLFLNGYWSDRYYGHTVRAVRARPFYFDQPSLELGQLPIGVTRRGQLTIVNMTTDVQTLTVTADAPFSLRQGSGSASSITLEVPGKSSDTVTVMFTATEPGEFNGNITFQNPAMEGGQSVIPVKALAYVKQDDTQHEYVDLGLPSGTLWATCNVGASAPEQYGDYFAWGEAEPKDVYNWSTYHQGTSQDAATVNWGPEWRRPSLDQYQELFKNCSWQWMPMNGVYGRLFTGPNGNSIFVPAAGFCSDDLIFSAGKECYSWLRTSYTSKSAYCMFFSKRSIGYSYWGSCCYGYTVRPVRVSQATSQSPLLEQQALYPDDESSEEMRFPELTILNHIPGDQELDAHRRYVYIDQSGKE